MHMHWRSFHIWPTYAHNVLGAQLQPPAYVQAIAATEQAERPCLDLPLEYFEPVYSKFAIILKKEGGRHLVQPPA